MLFTNPVLERFRSPTISHIRRMPSTPAEADLAAAGYLGGYYRTTDGRDRPWEGSTGGPPPPPPA